MHYDVRAFYGALDAFRVLQRPGYRFDPVTLQLFPTAA
jgi:hypothetical protein